MSGAFGVGCPDIVGTGILVEAAAILTFPDDKVAAGLEGEAAVYQFLPHLAQGRLSLSSTDAVTTTDQTAKTQIYFLPFMGNQLAYGTSNWEKNALASPSIKTTDTQNGDTANGFPTITNLASTNQLIIGMEVTGTGIPASTTIIDITGTTTLTLSQNATADGTGVALTFKLPASTNYDLFYAAGAQGFPGLFFSSAWASATARADDLTLKDGILVNANDIFTQDDGAVSATILAETGRYLGTFRTTATAGQTEDSEANRFLWNVNHRVWRSLKAVDTTNSWTYSTASFRQANALAANQLNFVIGQDWSPLLALVHVVTSSSAVVVIAAGIGLDSTTVDSSILKGSSSVTSSTGRLQTSAHLHVHPGIGYHYLAWLERGAGSGTQTWYGDNNLTYWQSGIMGGGMF